MKLRDVPAPVWYIGAAAIAAAVIYQLVKRGAAAVGSAVNPTNPDNVAAAGVNAVGAALSGDESFNLGGAIYDLFHSDPTKAPAAPAATYTRTPMTNVPNPDRPVSPTAGQKRGDLP